MDRNSTVTLYGVQVDGEIRWMSTRQTDAETYAATLERMHTPCQIVTGTADVTWTPI